MGGGMIQSQSQNRHGSNRREPQDDALLRSRSLLNSRGEASDFLLHALSKFNKIGTSVHEDVMLSLYF